MLKTLYKGEFLSGKQAILKSIGVIYCASVSSNTAILRIYVIVAINHESFVKLFKVSFSFFMGDFEPEIQDLHLNLSPFVNLYNPRARTVHDSMVIDLKTSVEVDYE